MSFSNPLSSPFRKGGSGGFENNLTKSFKDVKWKENRIPDFGI